MKSSTGESIRKTRDELEKKLVEQSEELIRLKEQLMHEDSDLKQAEERFRSIREFQYWSWMKMRKGLKTKLRKIYAKKLEESIAMKKFLEMEIETLSKIVSAIDKEEEEKLI